MNIADFIIAGCVIILLISLIPQIIYNFQYKVCEVTLKTSVPTSLALMIMAVTFSFLDLYFSFALNILTAIAWFVLIIQRIKIGKG